MTNGLKQRAVKFNLRFQLPLLIFCVAIFHSIVTSANQHQGPTQLLMIEEPGCVYCAKFNREIAPLYAKTTEGKSAPLRRLNLSDPWPEDLANIKSEAVTPTFILVHNYTEIGRLRGYQGDEFFWFLLNELLSKLPVTDSDQ